MPVVDAENKVLGIIATEDFAKLFFNDLDPQSVNRVPLQRDNLVRALKGRVLVEGRRKLGNRVIVGAMQAETMVDYVEQGCLVVLGDREDAQMAAIESGAGSARNHRRFTGFGANSGSSKKIWRARHQYRASYIYSSTSDQSEHQRTTYHESRVCFLSSRRPDERSADYTGTTTITAGSE